MEAIATKHTVRVRAQVLVDVIFDVVADSPVITELSGKLHLKRLIGSDPKGWDWNKAIWQYQVQNDSEMFLPLDQNDSPANMVFDFGETLDQEPSLPDTSDAMKQVCASCGSDCQPDDSECHCGGTIIDVRA